MAGLDKAVYRVRHRKWAYSKAAACSQSQPQTHLHGRYCSESGARHAPAHSDGTGLHPREQIGRQGCAQPRAARVVSALMRGSPVRRATLSGDCSADAVAHDRRAEATRPALAHRMRSRAGYRGRQADEGRGEGTEGAACAIMSCDNGIPFVVTAFSSLHR